MNFTLHKPLVTLGTSPEHIIVRASQYDGHIILIHKSHVVGQLLPDCVTGISNQDNNKEHLASVQPVTLTPNCPPKHQSCQSACNVHVWTAPMHFLKVLLVSNCGDLHTFYGVWRTQNTVWDWVVLCHCAVPLCCAIVRCHCAVSLCGGLKCSPEFSIRRID
jgi:hypothetical protein